jgi:hypothetical protein
VTVADGLRALLQQYARAVDQRDLATLEALFHPDAELTGARGTQSLGEWLEGMRAPRTFPTSMHLIGEPLIDHDEDTDTATMDTYAVVYQLNDADRGNGDLTLGMRYLDRAERYGGHWVFRHRTSQTLWMR